MWLEIYHSDNLIYREKDCILNEVNFSNSLMEIPTTNIDLPLYFLKYINGHENIKMFFDDGTVFWGIVHDIKLNKEKEIITINLPHILKEWEYRQVSTNNVIKNSNLKFIYEDNTTKKISINGNIVLQVIEFVVDEESVSESYFLKNSKAYAYNLQTNKEVSVSCTYKKATYTNDNGEEVEKNAYDVTFTASDVSLTKTYYMSERVKNRSISYTSSTSGNTYNYNYTYTYYNEKTINVSGIGSVSDYLNGNCFKYGDWEVEILDGAESIVDMIISRQNKYEALCSILDNTDSLYFRVLLENRKAIQIGTFGEVKDISISKYPNSKNNIEIVGEPTITYELANVVNIATVYSDKGDNGATSLSLREVYNDNSLQDDNFPVVILNDNINLERDYSRYVTEFPALAPNEQLEYAIIDLESVALECGYFIEGTFNYNDIYPTSDVFTDEEILNISDDDRIKSAKVCYDKTVKKLKENRRRYKITISVNSIKDIKVGDRISFRYDNSIYDTNECGLYLRHLIAFNDLWYINSIEYNTVNKTYGLTLEKFIRRS